MPVRRTLVARTTAMAAAQASSATLYNDSTSNPHGAASTWTGSPYQLYPDTRSSGTTEYSGVDRGWIFISTTSADIPTGHWRGANENVTEQYKPVTTRPMVLRALS